VSLAGGAALLADADWRRDPVFIIGQGADLVVYARNLVLIRRVRARGVTEMVGVARIGGGASRIPLSPGAEEAEAIRLRG